MTDGITQPARIRIDRMRAPIRRYDAEGSRILVENCDVVRALKNLELIRHAPRLRWNQGHAIRRRTGIIRSAHDSEFLCARFKYRSGRGCAPTASAASSATSVNA